jgi:hypothetical protein
MTKTQWDTFKASMEAEGCRFLDHSHFVVPKPFAKKLAAEVGKTLPAPGRELRVTVFGCLAWLRNPECKSEQGGMVVWGAEQSNTLPA